MNEFPDLDWLKWVLVNAQSMARRNTWMPLQPREVIKIASDRQLSLVQNGSQLLDVLIESLRRLEEKLQGETPASQFVWNEISSNVYLPKDEEAFSDYVKIHLDEDLKRKGIICNREVRIHRGKRTDIHVDAILQNHSGQSYDTVTAIIEVKGCWHQDLNHAMKTQLVDQYLKDNHCQHGLYLVGWFNCDLWDAQDHRHRRAPKLDIDQAQSQFDAQAGNLSEGGTQIRALVLNAALH
jgi:hypothetical protein